MSGPELPTERLLLRRWRDSDLDPFAALNADPIVMEHFRRPGKSLSALYLHRQRPQDGAQRHNSGWLLGQLDQLVQANHLARQPPVTAAIVAS